MRWCLVALVLAAISCSARVYTPCELAHDLKFYYSSYIPEKYVPLAVCIAGYHNYSKSNQLRHPDGRIFYGYFGLIAKPECPADILMDYSYFSGDWKCLKSQVIDVPEKFKLYEKLCGPKLVQKITCHFNEYFDYAEVFDPIHKDIFDLSYGEERVIHKILASYNITDDQRVTTSTTNEFGENARTMTRNSVLITQEIHETANKPQLVKNPSSQDIATRRHLQEYQDQTDDQFCFTVSQITIVICATLLAQTILIAAVIYVFTKLWKNLPKDPQAQEMNLFPLPTAPSVSMDDFYRKPFSGSPF